MDKWIDVYNYILIHTHVRICIIVRLSECVVCVYCSVLQRVAVCCSVLQCIFIHTYICMYVIVRLSECVICVCCSVLQRVAVCCSAFLAIHRVLLVLNLLQHAATHCNTTATGHHQKIEYIHTPTYLHTKTQT